MEDMSAVFNFKKRWPQGLTVLSNFVTEAEEEELVSLLLSDQVMKPKHKKKRKAVHKDIFGESHKSQTDEGI